MAIYIRDPMLCNPLAISIRWSTSGEIVDRKTVRSMSTAKTPAAEPSRAASSLYETIPVRTPEHAYMETDLDLASDYNASADNYSAIYPSLSSSTDTQFIVPVAIPDIELRGKVVYLKQIERYNENIDIAGLETLEPHDSYPAS